MREAKRTDDQSRVPQYLCANNAIHLDMDTTALSALAINM